MCVVLSACFGTIKTILASSTSFHWMKPCQYSARPPFYDYGIISITVYSLITWFGSVHCLMATFFDTTFRKRCLLAFFATTFLICRTSI